MDTLRDNLDFFSDDVKDFKETIANELGDLSNKRAHERREIIRVTNSMKMAIETKETALLAEYETTLSRHQERLQKCFDTSEEMEHEIASLQFQADGSLASEKSDHLVEYKFKYDALQDRFGAFQKHILAPVFKPLNDDIEAVRNVTIGTFEYIEAEAEDLSINFSAHRDADINPCFSVGILWVNNIIVISDKGNNKVKFFTENGVFLSELLFTNASPYGVCYVHDNTFAVTLPKVKQIYIVSLLENIAKVVSSFHTHSGYAGLCNGVRPRSMIASVASNTPGESHVDIIGFSGEVFLSFKNHPTSGVPLFKYPRFILANQGVLIVSDWRKDCVIFLHEATGSVLKEYKGTKEQPLVNPYDMSMDADGNIYIMNGKNGSIHVLDLQCNLVDVIIETSQLLSPRLISYDSARYLLAVTYGAGDIRSFYHCVRKPVAELSSPPAHAQSVLAPPTLDANARCPSPRF